MLEVEARLSGFGNPRPILGSIRLSQQTPMQSFTRDYYIHSAVCTQNTMYLVTLSAHLHRIDETPRIVIHARDACRHATNAFERMYHVAYSMYVDEWYSEVDLDEKWVYDVHTHTLLKLPPGVLGVTQGYRHPNPGTIGHGGAT